MQATTPTIHCDAEDGDCGRWDVDYYETCASSVGGVRITQDRRAPGWLSLGDRDLCPDHTSEQEGDDEDEFEQCPHEAIRATCGQPCNCYCAGCAKFRPADTSEQEGA